MGGESEDSVLPQIAFDAICVPATVLPYDIDPVIRSTWLLLPIDLFLASPVRAPRRVVLEHSRSRVPIAVEGRHPAIHQLQAVWRGGVWI